jgi:hypothetical protein
MLLTTLINQVHFFINQSYFYKLYSYKLFYAYVNKGQRRINEGFFFNKLYKLVHPN